jgi:hypothetical protein
VTGLNVQWTYFYQSQDSYIVQAVRTMLLKCGVVIPGWYLVKELLYIFNIEPSQRILEKCRNMNAVGSGTYCNTFSEAVAAQEAKLAEVHAQAPQPTTTTGDDDDADDDLEDDEQTEATRTEGATRPPLGQWKTVVPRQLVGEVL